MERTIISTLLVVLAAVGAQPSTAQPALQSIPDVRPLPYDVASIRRNVSGGNVLSAGMGDYHGRFGRANLTLRSLLATVFGVREHVIVGGPEWVDRNRYDVIVSAPELTVDRMKSAAWSVLQERFALTLRREVRELPIYELVRARSDGRLGPGLQAAGAGCRTRYNMQPNSSVRGTCLQWGRAVQLITNGLDRPFVDSTELKGMFDVDVQWTGETTVDVPADQRVSRFTAFEERLGLKLQPSRGPVERFVIEDAQLPTEN